SNLADAIKMSAPTTSAIITGNSADLIYSAFLSLGLSGATPPPTTTIISDNFGSRFFYDVTGNDAGNPHGDFAHLFMNQTNLPFTPSNWVVQNFDRNVVTTGNSRGSTIPLLMGNCPGPGAVFEIQHCVGNLMICDYVTSGFNFDGFSNSYFYRNTNVRSTPTNPPNSGAIGMSFPSPTQAANAVGKTFLGSNVGEAITNGNSATVIESGSVNLGINGASIPYTAIYPGSGGSRTSKTDALAAFTPSASFLGKGAYPDAYLDYTNRTYDKTLEPTFVEFDSLINQNTSTAVSSAWCKVLGGPDTQSWSVTGGTVQVADDASGTNATAAAASGTVARGKFMRINLTTSSSGSTTTTATVTINGYSYSF